PRRCLQKCQKKEFFYDFPERVLCDSAHQRSEKKIGAHCPEELAVNKIQQSSLFNVPCLQQEPGAFQHHDIEDRDRKGPCTPELPHDPGGSGKIHQQEGSPCQQFHRSENSLSVPH